MKKPFLISTSAFFDDKIRINDYIESFLTLKKFEVFFEKVILIETIKNSGVDYIENSGLPFFYSKIGNPYGNKGTNWIYHIDNFLKLSDIQHDDVIVFITGRYKMLNTNIIDLISKHIYSENNSIIAKDDRDIYNSEKSGVHTFFFAFKKYKFLEFKEWYQKNGDEKISVEWDLKKFMLHSKECKILDKNTKLGIETNISTSRVKKIC